MLTATLKYLYFFAFSAILYGHSMVATAQVTTNNNDIIVTYLPDFYYLTPKRIADTLYEMKAYDKAGNLLEDITQFGNVSYISVYKNYTDYSHTYKDKGKDLPLPVSVIVYRYDRLGKTKWMYINYPEKKQAFYTEHRDVLENHSSIVDPNGKIIEIQTYRVQAD